MGLKVMSLLVFHWKCPLTASSPDQAPKPCWLGHKLDLFRNLKRYQDDASYDRPQPARKQRSLRQSWRVWSQIRRLGKQIKINVCNLKRSIKNLFHSWTSSNRKKVMFGYLCLSSRAGCLVKAILLFRVTNNWNKWFLQLICLHYRIISDLPNKRHARDSRSEVHLVDHALLLIPEPFFLASFFGAWWSLQTVENCYY